MVKIPFTVFGIFFCLVSFGQNFSGQWKGSFVDLSNNDNDWGDTKCDYVLDLNVKGQNVTGLSYTYYIDNGKKYYTICKLSGKVNTAQSTIEVKEIERTKTNVPSNISNCFQVHTLTYTASGSGELLTGEWHPVKGNCGYGKTTLVKRIFNSVAPIFNSKAFVSPARPPAIAKATTTPVKAVSKEKAVKPTKQKETLYTISSNAKLKPALGIEPSEINLSEPLPSLRSNVEKSIVYEKRISNLIRSLDVENASIRIEFYDNGKIDGDSISVFFNEKLMIAQQMLNEKPITLTLNLQPGENILVMYADNLGSIPPNTALMVVRDGDRKYEIGMSSDLNKSGTIRLVRRQ